MPEEKKLTGYPSMDKPWLKYYSEEAISSSLLQGTLYENIQKNNCDYPDQIALIYFGRKITYRQMFECIEQTRNAFLNYGIKKGDKVILFTSATPETVYTILALCRIGAVANMINPLFTEEQVVDRINETDASLMIVLDQLYDRVSDVIEKTCVKTAVVVPVYGSMPSVMGLAARLKMKKDIPYGKSVISWKDFACDAKNDAPDAAYEKDRPLVMVYSSGTTGASKGIVLTNDGINATLSNYFRQEYFPRERGETFLQMIPVWFSTGVVLSILMPLCMGVSVILEPVFSKESFARDIKKYQPNMTLAATSLWLYAMKCNELKNSDLSAMRYPITGGELVLPRVEAALNEFLNAHGCTAPLLKGYGMCELGGTVTTDSADHCKPGAAGYPIMGVTVAAFDMETNAEKRYGERGELRVASPCRMKEYFKNPEATKEYFWTDDNGTVWGRTGDMGYVDEDGFVYVLGRCSDHFRSQANRDVYCFDIENVILDNANVAQWEVVGLPDGAGYNVPVAQIVLEDNCTTSAEDLLSQIDEHCVTILDPDYVPCGYKIVEAFPVKNNGKRDMELIRQDRTGYVMPKAGGLETVSFK